jgi:hypothetical protein
MRKLLTWIVVTVGIAALVRKLRSRRHEGASTAEAPPAGGDPADELRQKLATSREAAAPNAGASEPPTPEPTSEPSIDERRTEVHDEGRAAIDEMRKSAED